MLADLLHALVPSAGLATLGAGLGGLGGALLPTYAAQRTLAQPVAFALADETVVLAGVLGDLRRYPYVSTIAAAAFAANHHHNLWKALTEVLGPDGNLPEDISEDDCAVVGARLAGRREEILTALAARLEHTNQPDTDAARLAELLTLAETAGYRADVDADRLGAADAAVVTAAENVLGAGNDRVLYAGTGLITPATDPNSLEEDQPPLVRTWTAPTRARRTTTAVLTGLLGLLLPGFAFALPTAGAATALALVALAVLAVTSIVISLVDLDTLYIDIPVWAVGTATAWAATVAAALAAHDPARLWCGVGMVLGVVVLFEGTNLLYKKLRGRDGQGFGDTLIILATVGIPPALTGDYRLGYYSVMGGLIAGALGWGVNRIAGKVTRETPFAFGPWLSLGWVISMLWFVYSTTFILDMV